MIYSIVNMEYEWLCLFLCVLVSTKLLQTGALDTGPPGWERVRRAKNLETVQVTFAIKQSMPWWLESKLRAVSYPDSPEYGRYMSFEEIAEHVYGLPESVQAVLDALESVGITGQVDFTLGRDFAVVRDMPVSAAEKLFRAEFHHYQYVQIPSWTTIKSLKFSLPATLYGHVDFISGINDFARPNRIRARMSHMNYNASEVVDPVTIDKVYNISGYVASNPSSSQAVAAFLFEYYGQKDLNVFEKKYNLSNATISIHGFNNMSSPGLEAELDIEYICGVGRNVTTWFVSVPKPSGGHEDFLSYIITQINTTDSPWVHSVSYADIEPEFNRDFIERTNNEFMKFGISGRTILVASGDSGMYCHNKEYVPYWPASSPYVTTVGGTKPDHVSIWPGSGGGFSDVSVTPDYQKAAVAKYLSTMLTPLSVNFSRNGRAYPDLTSFSEACITEYEGRFSPLEGTSCATPIIAGRYTCTLFWMAIQWQKSIASLYFIFL